MTVVKTVIMGINFTLLIVLEGPGQFVRRPACPEIVISNVSKSSELTYYYGRLKFNLELGISDSGIRALLRIESLVEARAATTGNQRHDRVIRLVRTRHARTRRIV
jgi:hypothetical protein